MLETTGCDAIMLGRAACGDPWVFRRVRAFWEHGERLPLPTAAERLETSLRHLQMMVAAIGEERAAREMRKHAAWYVRGLPHSAQVREQVNRARSADEMALLLGRYREALERHGHDGPATRRPEDTVAAG
jgi:tRNA-dihydrouridine synthase B